MLAYWKSMSYRSRVRLCLIIAIVLLGDIANNIGLEQLSIRKVYTARIKELEAEVGSRAAELEAIKIEYRDALTDIVETVYEREFYSMGGYDTDHGADVTEIYEAIQNEVRDYRPVLEDASRYFNARREYLSEIPSVWPIEYNELTSITSGFGWRLSPITGKVGYHAGLDISGVWNAKIIAPADGTVVEHWLVPGYYGGVLYRGHRYLGGMIKLQHAGGFETVFGHLSKSFVSEGDTVRRGDVIGIMGDTGTSKGRHLHYEIHHNGVPVNPIEFLQF